LARFLPLLPTFFSVLLSILFPVLFSVFLSYLFPIALPARFLALLFCVPALGAATFAFVSAFSLLHVTLSFWSAFRIAH